MLGADLIAQSAPAGFRAGQPGSIGLGNKVNDLYSLIPAFSLKGEGACTCVDTYGLMSGSDAPVAIKD
jgi:hypothetical protein